MGNGNEKDDERGEIRRRGGAERERERELLIKRQITKSLCTVVDIILKALAIKVGGDDRIT